MPKREAYLPVTYPAVDQAHAQIAGRQSQNQESDGEIEGRESGIQRHKAACQLQRGFA